MAYLGFCERGTGEGERRRREVRGTRGAVKVDCEDGVSLPIGRGLGRVLCPSPEFFNVWFKNKPFFFNFCVQAKIEKNITQCP